MFIKRIARKTVDFMAAHPRITMAAIAVGASFALSFTIATIDGAPQTAFAYSRFNNQQNAQGAFNFRGGG